MATNITPDGGLDVGDGATITATFLDDQGDPATVLIDDLTVTYLPPSGESVAVDAGDITVTDGVVSYLLVFNEGGRWHGRTAWANGTDAPQVDEWWAYVRRSSVPAPAAP